MSDFPSKTKRKAINIKSLILQSHEDLKYKYQNLKLSSLNKLCHTYEEEPTEQSEKFLMMDTSKKKISGLCKTNRDSSKKSLGKINFYAQNIKNNFFFNNFVRNRNNLICFKKEEGDSLNKMMNTYRGTNDMKNHLLLEYSGIKPKKQKFIKINKIKPINKKQLINKIFHKSNILIQNLSRNNNNNISFKTNKSNTFFDNDLNNFTQRSTYIENQKINPLLTKRVIKDKPNNHPKKKINIINSRNIIELMISNSHRNNILTTKLNNNPNIFRTFNQENRNNSKNHNNNFDKKKTIQLLMKQKKKSLNKTLPFREKILKAIQNSIIIKKKFKLNKSNIKNINSIKRSNNLKNTITYPNNQKITKIKKIKEINVQKNSSKLIKNKNNIFSINPKNKEGNKPNQNPHYNKSVILSPVIPKQKESKTLIKRPIYKKVTKIVSCTLPGYTSSGVQKINQDNLFIKNNFLNQKDQYFIGVCDGHGDYGHLISSYLSQSLPNFLADISDQSIISSYISLNQNLVQNSKIDCTLSGSTCSSIILNPENIISINLGDSRTVLAKYEKGKYTAINLSIDHKPNVGYEKKRILINGGRIKPFYDEESKQFLGPDRVWISEDNIPGLAMTRSFGDIIAHSVGVISEPEIKRYDFIGNEKFIIIASDGIWEYMTSEECVNLVKDFYENNLDAIGAINIIMKEAFNRWKINDEIIDDITAIVIFF